MLQFGRYFTKAEIAEVLTDGNGHALNLNAAESISYGSGAGQTENLKQFARAAVSFSDTSLNAAYLYCPFKATNDTAFGVVANNNHAHAEMTIFIYRNIASLGDNDIAGFTPKDDHQNGVNDPVHLALEELDDQQTPDYITDPNAPVGDYFIALYIAGIAGGLQGSSNNIINRGTHGWIALSVIFNTYGYAANNLPMFANSFNEQTGAQFNQVTVLYAYQTQEKSLGVETVADMTEQGFEWVPTILDLDGVITTMDQLAAIINGEEPPEPPTPPTPSDLEGRVEALESQMGLLKRTYSQI